MWKRNLLFLGLIGGGLVALGANLMPPRVPKPVTSYDASAYQADDFRAVVSAVDASFQKDWENRSFTPADPAPELAIARRLALGLMGTIPSLEEIRQFEYLPAEERLPWWIDHVLQDRRFADYLAERLARSYVGVEDGPFILYRRRRFVNWISEQLVKSRPYDQIVHDLITANGLWTNEPATNFLTVTSQQNKKNEPNPIRLAGRVTRSFLGIRLDCAECHNHPFAKWKQSDFQGLAAFFGKTKVGFSGVVDSEGIYRYTNVATNEKVRIDARVPFAAELLPAEGTLRERLAAWVTSPKNPFFAKAIVNRIWTLMLGKALVDPIDNLDVELNPPPALQILADDLIAHDFDLRRLIRLIASTQVFRLDSASEDELTQKHEDAFAVFPLTRLRGEQVVGGIVQTSSVSTINADSHIFVRIARATNQNDFLKRYGDTGEDEFEGRGGTIPQRLLMMNGDLIRERIKADVFTATSRIANQSPNDAHAIEAAYLTILTRRPSAEELAHFTKTLTDPDPERNRGQRFEDLFWVLINSTEFSWNH